MLSFDLKHFVLATLAVEWEDFAQRHPRLAAVIDQELLLEQAMTDLASTPEYQQALAEAQATGAITTAALTTLRALVRQALHTLGLP